MESDFFSSLFTASMLSSDAKIEDSGLMMTNLEESSYTCNS